MKKIYLSPENRPAPHGPYTGFPGVYEHDVCCEIAALEAAVLERCGCSVTIADPGKTMAARCAEANAGGFDLYQTIHTNAGGGTGAECLYYGKEGGASYKANLAVYDELVKLYPSRRGLKDGNGYFENMNTRMVSVYPELAFHDNPADAAFLVSHKAELAEALAKGVLSFLGVDWVEEAPEAQVIYTVQVGAFASRDNAEGYAETLRGQGIQCFVTTRK